MCGIVGLVVKAKYGPSKAEEDAFYDMLFVDQLRGDDSTGVIIANNDGGFGIMKDAYPAYWMTDTFKNHEIGKTGFRKGKAFIGHNRKATIGNIVAETTHPFVVDKRFAMVHNGTLKNHKKLADTVVDSEALAIHLSKVIVKDFKMEAFEEAIGKVDGAYAVVCYEQESHCVYMFRNYERPLALVESNSVFAWSSELGTAAWILNRHGLSNKDTKMEMVEVNTLYKIDLNTNTLTKEKFTPKKHTAHQATTQLGGQSSSGTSTKYTKRQQQQREKESFDESEVSKNLFRRYKRRHLGTTILFECDDWVEKNFPRTLFDGETELLIMGESASFDHQHCVQGVFDCAGVDESEITGRMYTGRVYDMEYCRDTRSMKIKVNEVKAVPKSLEKPKQKAANDETTPTLHIVH